MKYAKLVLQIILGAAFIVFGINHFIQFMKPDMSVFPADGAAFMGLLVSSGYMGVIKAFEVIGGVLLITNRYAPLGATILAPITLNILLFHAFLAPFGLPIAIGLFAINWIVIFMHWNKFKQLLN